MSLDVYIEEGIPAKKECIHCGSTYEKSEVLFEANITHNLGKMAEKAGIYQYLWRPEELGITKADELVEPLSKAHTDLVNRPEYYKQFDAENGWGTYEDFVPWLRNYINACIIHRDGLVRVSR